jgi:hypothetical protein
VLGRKEKEGSDESDGSEILSQRKKNSEERKEPRSVIARHKDFAPSLSELRR